MSTKGYAISRFLKQRACKNTKEHKMPFTGHFLYKFKKPSSADRKCIHELVGCSLPTTRLSPNYYTDTPCDSDGQLTKQCRNYNINNNGPAKTWPQVTVEN